jgi:hypothetical protein
MTSAFLLAGLLYFKVVQIPYILALRSCPGTAQSFGGPLSGAGSMLVDKEDLPNAISLNSISSTWRVIGPVLGGPCAKLGAIWCFFLNGLSFIAVIISLYKLRVNFAPEKPRKPFSPA